MARGNEASQNETQEPTKPLTLLTRRFEEEVSCEMKRKQEITVEKRRRACSGAANFNQQESHAAVQRRKRTDTPRRHFLFCFAPPLPEEQAT